MFLTLEELGSAENHTEMPACQTKQKREDRCSGESHDPGAARWSPDVLRLVAEAWQPVLRACNSANVARAESTHLEVCPHSCPHALIRASPARRRLPVAVEAPNEAL